MILNADEAVRALDLCARLTCLAVIHGALHSLVASSEVDPGGVLDLRVSERQTWRMWDKVLWRLLGHGFYCGRSVRRLAVLQIALGFVGLIGPGVWFVFLSLLLIDLLLQPVLRIGMDGADEMIRLLTALCALRSITDDPVVQIATVAFLGGQLALAYLTSGLSKSQAVVWWNGMATRGIFSTEYFGVPWLARALNRSLAVARTLSWSIVVWETTFVLMLLMPGNVFLIALLIGLLFHLLCAAIMGLDAFVLAFLASYPPVVLLNGWLNDWLSTSLRVQIAGAIALSMMCFAAVKLRGELRRRGSLKQNAATPSVRSGISARLRWSSP